MRFNLDDTIAAISTPIGESGIGIVRMSGKDALKIADRIFFSKDDKKPSEFKTYTTHYGWIMDRNQKPDPSSMDAPSNQKREVIDEVILTVMRKPKSYTKEDIVEINCHGGIVPLRKTLELVLKEGARLAEPGEFTLRAFLNGRIDLSQAEAVLDIIRAKTDKALEIGLRQLRGELSAKIKEIRSGLMEILANLEADIDFPLEEIETLSKEEILRRSNPLIKGIKDLISSSEKGRIFREGVSLVICGKPNVGKSSLLNCLLNEERAIVTPIAGTTRDTIEEIIDIKGIPFKITDTAGILEPKDLPRSCTQGRGLIEKEVVRRSQRAIEQADLILMLFDGSLSISNEDKFLLKKIRRKNFIPVVNKIDLRQKIDLKKLKFDPVRNFTKKERKKGISNGVDGLIKISALRKIGIEKLEEEIVNRVYKGQVSISQELLVSNIRHVDALRRSLEALQRTEKNILNDLSSEFLTIDLKEAINCLGEITGDSMVEDLLDRIFSGFCIGK